MNVIKEFDKTSLVNGAVQTINLLSYPGTSAALIYIMNGHGLAGTSTTGGVPDVQKAPYGEGVALHCNAHGDPISIDVGNASSSKLHIREFSNGGRGTNIPGMENKLTYKVVLTGCCTSTIPTAVG